MFAYAHGDFKAEGATSRLRFMSLRSLLLVGELEAVKGSKIDFLRLEAVGIPKKGENRFSLILEPVLVKEGMGKKRLKETRAYFGRKKSLADTTVNAFSPFFTTVNRVILPCLSKQGFFKHFLIWDKCVSRISEVHLERVAQVLDEVNLLCPVLGLELPVLVFGKLTRL